MAPIWKWPCETSPTRGKKMSKFTETFLVDFFQSIHKIEKNNWDVLMFSEDHPRAKNFMVDNAVRWMHAIMRNIEKYDEAYELLEDDYSKALMVRLLEYSILDHHHVKLPLNTPEFWKQYNSVDEQYLLEREALDYYDKKLNLYQYPEGGIKFYGNVLTVLTHFILKQYYFRRGPAIMPEAGDVCIDAGACRGEVSLQFAHSAGESGSVYSFEFVPANLEVVQKNLEMNPHLSRRVHVVPHALWHSSGVEIPFSESGPSTNLVAQGSQGGSQDGSTTQKATTLSIDDLVKKQGLNRVDFIKMDIEGAEAEALMGASGTIQTFNPKLAICVYHKKDDFYKIPTLIQQLCDGYSFYLDHYTIHRHETVLYGLHKSRIAG